MKISPLKSRILCITLIPLTILSQSCATQRPVADSVTTPEYTIEQFYANKRITGGTFSPDETKLLVSSNETGIFNLFEIDILSGSMQQLTDSTTESLFAVSYVPTTGEVLYSADKGGDENSHLYLLKKSGESIDLTPRENEKVFFEGWSKDKLSFFYTSNRRDPSYFDVYRMNVASWTDSMIYQNENGLLIGQVSESGDKLTLVETITTSENKLFLHDLTSSETTEISELDEKGTYTSDGFSEDGLSLFYTSNGGSEFRHLARYDIQTGSREVIYEPEWDVMYSYASENEKYRVIGVNADAKTVLKVIDNATGEDVEMPEIPDGDVLGVSIASSEKKMRLSIGTSRSPTDNYVYEFESKELKRVTDTLNPEIDSEHLVTADVIRYPSFDGLEIPSVFYKPHTATVDNPVPALVLVHGGPGGQSRVGFRELTQFLVNHGYAVLAVNNRGSSGYGKTFHQLDDRNHGEGDLMDCIYGKRYLQSLDYIDSDNIGIIGGSYGGFITMAAMTLQPDEFKVGVNIFGVTNWVRTLKSIPPHWAAFKDALYAEMGDPFSEEDAERLHRISPVFHGDQVKNPVMVLQGANDIRVLQVESDDMVEAMRANDVPVEYVIFPDEGHGFRKKENQIKGYGQVLSFLEKYMKGEDKGI